MAVAVTIEGVTKRFGTTTAVDHVSLRIEPGELFFLLGPSGCGKTTLLRSIAGFVEPDEGTIRLGPVDITRLPPHRRDTGMVFQSYALWPHLTLAQNVAFGLEMRGLPRDAVRTKVAQTLALVHMADRAAARPNQLSGGQQQRIALARALVVEPRCLLLDEPLSNLDAKLRLEMRTEIRRICKAAGLTSVYVTHDQKEALSIADRIAVLRDGRVQQVGTPLEIYRQPASAFVAGFIGEANLLHGLCRVAGGAPPRVATPLGEWVPATLPATAREGAPATLCLRPETVRFDTPPDGCPNVFRGHLTETVYLGEVAQHQLHLERRGDAADGPVLQVFELNPRRMARERPTEVRVWVAPEDLVAWVD